MTFRFATPADLARMSWYQREKYHARRRAYARALEAERPITAAQRDPLRAIIQVLAAELDQIGRATKPKPRKPKPAPEVNPCGTVAAYRRHTRHGEDPCPECRAAERLRSADRRAAARARRSAA